MKKIVALTLAVVMVLGLLAGCGAKTPTTGTTTPSGTNTSTTTTTSSTAADTGTAESTEPKVLKMSMAGDVESYNLYNQPENYYTTDWFSSFLYRKAPEGDLGVKFVCDIAADFPEKVAPCTWNIKIREDACFHNGTPINAETFVYSAQVVLDPVKVQSRANTYLSTIDIVNAKAYANQTVDGTTVDWGSVGIKAVDEYTLQLTLSEDGYTAENSMTWSGDRVCVPVEKAMWESCMGSDGTTTYGIDLDHFVACGPYYFTEWVSGALQVYEKNGDHWLADLFNVDRVEYRVAADNNAKWELFQKGELDFTLISGDLVFELLDDPHLIPYTTTLIYHMDMNKANPDNPVCNTQNYRKALYHAIDRETISSSVLPNMIPSGTYISNLAGIDSPDHSSYRDSEQGKAVDAMIAADSADGHTTGYNPQLAREYLAKAYEECGLSADYILTIKYCYDPTDNVYWGLIGQFLEQDMEAVFEGKVDVVLTNASGSSRAFKDGNPSEWDLYPMDWVKNTQTTYPFTNYLSVTTLSASHPNDVVIPEFEDQYNYLESIKVSADYETQKDETQKLEELAYETAFILPICQRRNYILKSEKLILPVADNNPLMNGQGFGYYYADIAQ